MKKVAVVTATRAEYGLLKPLLTLIDQEPEFTLQLIVTGAHLCKEFGLTYKEIEKDFKIDATLPIDLQENTDLSNSLAMAQLQTQFTLTCKQLQPDLIVILGDRYEMLSIATTATLLHIPIAHIHGGEITQGAVDDALRHAITKLSHLHFTSTQHYKKRVIQMGEEPSRVFHIGSLGVEALLHLPLLNKKELESVLKFSFKKKNLLITYHPQTLASMSPQEQIQKVLDALEELHDTGLIFTKANADAGGVIINEMIDTFVKRHPNAIAFTSLGQLRYFSTLKYVDGVVGNSSSGILEVPSFHITTIDIGERQKGRIAAQSVINTPIDTDAIKKAIETLYTPSWQTQLQKVTNPYFKVNTALNIIEILKKTHFHTLLTKKFYDLEC